MGLPCSVTCMHRHTPTPRTLHCVRARDGSAYNMFDPTGRWAPRPPHPAEQCQHVTSGARHNYGCNDGRGSVLKALLVRCHTAREFPPLCGGALWAMPVGLRQDALALCMFKTCLWSAAMRGGGRGRPIRCHTRRHAERLLKGIYTTQRHGHSTSKRPRPRPLWSCACRAHACAAVEIACCCATTLHRCCGCLPSSILSVMRLTRWGSLRGDESQRAEPHSAVLL